MKCSGRDTSECGLNLAASRLIRTFIDQLIQGTPAYEREIGISNLSDNMFVDQQVGKEKGDVDQFIIGNQDLLTINHR